LILILPLRPTVPLEVGFVIPCARGRGYEAPGSQYASMYPM
jgi:hypothetical protein